VYSSGSGTGQLPGGNTVALTGCPKHARRAGSISDAGDRAEKYNRIITKPESILAFVTLFFSAIKTKNFPPELTL
jgi:hypothetical protein